MTATHKLLVRLMQMSLILRCFVIALILHFGVLLMIGTVQLARYVARPPTPPLPVGPIENLGGGNEGPVGPVEPPPRPTKEVGPIPPVDDYRRSFPPPTTERPIVHVVEQPDGGSGDFVVMKGNCHTGGKFSPGDWRNDLGGIHVVNPILTNRPGLRPPGTKGTSPPSRLPPTEKNVLAGLRWLKANQNAEDGSWDCRQSKIAGTALAVLAFLGHGDGPDSKEFGRTVQDGLQFLVRNVDENGLVKDKNMYAQGVTTLALAEAYGITRATQLRGSLERAVNAILKSQQASKGKPEHVGGWRYSPTSADSDCSVSGWMIMSLKSAQLAGLELPAASTAAATKYLWNMYDEAGGFGYADNRRTPNMTAVGTLCQQFLGHSRDTRLRKALEYLKTQKADWAATEGGWVLYGWYYATQAMFQAGDKYWAAWEPQIRKAFTDAQADDGHWDAPPGSSREKDAGPAYSTALGCLILEVYYRYLPIYRDHELQPAITLTANVR